MSSLSERLGKGGGYGQLGFDLTVEQTTFGM